MKKKTYASYIESIYHNIEDAVAKDIAGSGSPWWGVAISEKIATGPMLDEYYKALMADLSLSTEEKDHITALYDSYRNLYAAALDTASKAEEIIRLDQEGYAKKQIHDKISAVTSKATVLPPLEAEQVKADTEYSDKIVAKYQPIFQPGAGQGSTKIPVIENSANAVIRHIAAKTFNATPIVNELIPELEVYIAELKAKAGALKTEAQAKVSRKELEELEKCKEAMNKLKSKLGSSFVSISQLQPDERYYLSYGLEKITLRYGGLFSLKNKKEDQEKNTKWGNIFKVSSYISEDQYNLALKEIKSNSPKGTDLSKLSKLQYSAVEKAFNGVKSEEDAKKIMLDLVGTDAAGLAAGAKSSPPPDFNGFDIVKWREETLKPLYSQKNLYSFMLDISARLRFIDTHPLEVVRYNAYADRAKSPEKYNALVAQENSAYWALANSLMQEFSNHYARVDSDVDAQKIKSYFEVLIRSTSQEKIKFMLDAFDKDIIPLLPSGKNLIKSDIKSLHITKLFEEPERRIELLKLLQKVSAKPLKYPIDEGTITGLNLLDSKLNGVKTEQIRAFNQNERLANVFIRVSNFQGGGPTLEHLIKIIKRPNLYEALSSFLPPPPDRMTANDEKGRVSGFETNIGLFDKSYGQLIDVDPDFSQFVKDLKHYLVQEKMKDLKNEFKIKPNDTVEISDETYIKMIAIAKSRYSGADRSVDLHIFQDCLNPAMQIVKEGTFLNKKIKLVIDWDQLERNLNEKGPPRLSTVQPPAARFSQSRQGFEPQTPVSRGAPPPARFSQSRQGSESQIPVVPPESLVKVHVSPTPPPVVPPATPKGPPPVVPPATPKGPPPVVPPATPKGPPPVVPPATPKGPPPAIAKQTLPTISETAKAAPQQTVTPPAITPSKGERAEVPVVKTLIPPPSGVKTTPPPVRGSSSEVIGSRAEFLKAAAEIFADLKREREAEERERSRVYIPATPPDPAAVKVHVPTTLSPVPPVAAKGPPPVGSSPSPSGAKTTPPPSGAKTTTPLSKMEAPSKPAPRLAAGRPTAEQLKASGSKDSQKPSEHAELYREIMKQMPVEESSVTTAKSTTTTVNKVEASLVLPAPSVADSEKKPARFPSPPKTKPVLPPPFQQAQQPVSTAAAKTVTTEVMPKVVQPEPAPSPQTTGIKSPITRVMPSSPATATLKPVAKAGEQTPGKLQLRQIPPEQVKAPTPEPAPGLQTTGIKPPITRALPPTHEPAAPNKAAPVLSRTDKGTIVVPSVTPVTSTATSHLPPPSKAAPNKPSATSHVSKLQPPTEHPPRPSVEALQHTGSVHDIVVQHNRNASQHNAPQKPPPVRPGMKTTPPGRPGAPPSR